jgi:hypothetical protein
MMWPKRGVRDNQARGAMEGSTLATAEAGRAGVSRRYPVDSRRITALATGRVAPAEDDWRGGRNRQADNRQHRECYEEGLTKSNTRQCLCIDTAGGETNGSLGQNRRNWEVPSRSSIGIDLLTTLPGKRTQQSTIRHTDRTWRWQWERWTGCTNFKTKG